MASSPQMTLHYFDARRRGEVVRLMFAAGGLKRNVDYVDHRISEEEWKTFKAETPLGYVPVLDLGDGRKLSESLVICRMLAQRHGLVPANADDAVRCDMLATAVRQILDHQMKVRFEESNEDRRNAYRQQLKTSLLPGVLGTLNSAIKGKYIFGDQLSWADVVFFDAVWNIVHKNEKMISMFGDKLLPLFAAIKEHPRIAAHLEERPKTDY